jgi:hypothetical protein
MLRQGLTSSLPNRTVFVREELGDGGEVGLRRLGAQGRGGRCSAQGRKWGPQFRHLPRVQSPSVQIYSTRPKWVYTHVECTICLKMTRKTYTPTPGARVPRVGVYLLLVIHQQLGHPTWLKPTCAWYLFCAGGARTRGRCRNRGPQRGWGRNRGKPPTGINFPPTNNK